MGEWMGTDYKISFPTNLCGIPTAHPFLLPFLKAVDAAVKRVPWWVKQIWGESETSHPCVAMSPMCTSHHDEGSCRFLQAS